MAKIKIELNHAEVARRLKGADLVKAVEGIGDRIAAAATANAGTGAVFGHDVIIGQNRAHGMVWTDNVAAMRAEATGRALTRAIDAGRG